MKKNKMDPQSKTVMGNHYFVNMKETWLGNKISKGNMKKAKENPSKTCFFISSDKQKGMNKSRSITN